MKRGAVQRRQDSQPRAPQGRLAPWTSACGLLVLVVLAYLPAMQGAYIWDDDQYVYNNPHLRSAAGLARIWIDPRSTPQYYPLVFTSFWIEHAIWGTQPLGFHLVNVILHVASVILLWRLLMRLEVPGAWVAAAVFGLHPVHVESVAWITERKNVLSGFFYLAAAWCYLAPTKPAADEADAPATALSPRRYIAAMAFYICAILSKTVACSWPAAMLLVEWWKTGSIQRRSLSKLAPFFALGLGAGLLTAWIEREHVGAAGPEFAFSFAQRILIAGRAVWFYLGKLIWPHPLIFIYPRWQLDTNSLAQIAWPIAAVALLVLLIAMRKRTGRAPLAAALFFGGTLLPALGFVNVYPMRFSFVADHFQYLASIGPITLLVGMLALWLRKRKLPLLLPAGLYLATLSLLTWNQGYLYANEEHLWRETVKMNPTAFIALNNIGFAEGARGEIDTAIATLTRAVNLNPTFAEGQTNLGCYLLQKGRLPEAMAHLTEAVRLDPTLSDAQGNLGVALFHSGRTDEAITHFREAIRLKGDNFTARYNLGCILVSRGAADEAAEHLLVAVRLNPNDEETRANLNKALAMKKGGQAP